MSRSGYIEDCDDNWGLICHRGAVASAMRGKRGQVFLKEMIAALDALPERRLIADDLEAKGEVCAIGAVGKVRRIDMAGIDPEDSQRIAATFGISETLAREIMFMNDEYLLSDESAENRFIRMRAWIDKHIKK